MEDQEFFNDQAKKRNWTVEEENTFMTILEELVAKGVRSEGGNFKGGTYSVAAKMMNERLPGCKVTSKNIANKLKRMKEKYAAAANMVNQSGFRWNDTKKCVEVNSRQLLEEYLQKHPSAPVIAGKAFPLFKRLQDVFASDRVTDRANGNAAESPRANGNSAETPANVLKELGREEEIKGDDDMEQEIPSTSPPLVSNASLTSASTSQNHSRKRDRESEDASNRGIDRVRQDLMMIVQKLTSDTTARAGVAEELTRMQLTEDEKIEAGIKLMDNPQYISLFWGFKGHLRDAFVKRVLRG